MQGHMIIDYHAHVKRDRRTGKYLLQELLQDMDQNGIRMRLVSAMEGSSVSAQNDAVAEMVRSHPHRLLGCAVINPKADDAVEEMQRISAMEEFRAVEMDSFEHGYLPESCPHVDEILELAEERGMPVNVYTGSGRRTVPHQWGWYAKRHPAVNFVMLHMGGVDFGYSCVDLAEALPNVYLETSDQIELQVLRKAWDRLPGDRMLFGSKYPVLFTRCSAMTFDMLKLTWEQREQLFFRNAQRLLGISAGETEAELSKACTV